MAPTADLLHSDGRSAKIPAPAIAIHRWEDGVAALQLGAHVAPVDATGGVSLDVARPSGGRLVIDGRIWTEPRGRLRCVLLSRRTRPLLG